MNVRRNMNMFLVFVLLFSLFTGAFQTTVNAEELGNKATVTVVGNENVPVLSATEVIYEENATALDVLSDAVEGDLDAPDTDWGKSINRIKDVEASAPYFWAFYVNGISAQVGADSYKVQSGDQVSFRLTDWNLTPENTVSIKVVGNNNTLLDLSNVAFTDQPTAFQLLQVAAGPDQVTYDQYDFGKMITSINGVKAEGTNFWAFYVNGESASEGADSYKLKAGDQISFQYESWAPPVEEEPGDGNTNPPSEPISAETLQTSIDQAIAFIPEEGVGEWEAVALKQAGKNIPANYLEKVTNIIKEKNGTFRNITDYERYTLGVLAAGGDPTNVAGYNLVSSIYNGDVTKQGLIGVAYALLALDSANFQIPESALWTREKLVNYLIESQNQDSGWAWDGDANSDLDTTAMVLSALAPYKDQDGVKEKVEAAVGYLSKNYLDSKIDNSSTTAQVIIALSALGIDLNGELFTKDGSSIVSYLLTFKNQDNGFGWKLGDDSSVFSTGQVVQALVAYQLKMNGKGSLYSLPLSPQNPVTEQPVIEVPTVETPQAVNPQTAEPVKKVTNSTAQVGKRLPNTATDMYNLLALGMLVMVIGIALYMIGKRRKV